jgi:hypothetical protein
VCRRPLSASVGEVTEEGPLFTRFEKSCLHARSQVRNLCHVGGTLFNEFLAKHLQLRTLGIGQLEPVTHAENRFHTPTHPGTPHPPVQAPALRCDLGCTEAGGQGQHHRDSSITPSHLPFLPVSSGCSRTLVRPIL